MDRRNLISVTLLVTALAFNPLFAEHTIKTNIQVKENRVTSNIASILHKRGLDEDAAQEISKDFVNENDELFAMMIENLLEGCNSVNRDEIMEYLSRVALHKQDVHFGSYGQLVHMVSTIKQKALDESTLAQLSMIAKQNTLILG